MDSNKVSIIIPVYNAEAYLNETLQSVHNQTHFNWECILVDDQSTDVSIEVCNKWVKRDNRFRFFKRPVSKPKGANACRNFGLDNLTGEYVLFLDSDDLLGRNCLEARIKRLTENPELDFGVFPVLAFDHETRKGKDIMLSTSDDTPLAQFLKGQLAWCISSPLWRREFIRSFRFEETLKRFQDFEFHIRVVAQNPYFKIFSKLEPDIFYRKHLTNFDPLATHKQNNSIDALEKLFYLVYKHSIDKIEYREGLKNIFWNRLSNSLQLEWVRELKSWMISNGRFSLKERLQISILQFYQNSRLQNKKGFGYAKLYQLLTKEHQTKNKLISLDKEIDIDSYLI